MTDQNGEADSKKRKHTASHPMDPSDALIHSTDPQHPANHICELCRNFYQFGWVTGTGGGVSIKHENHIFIAPSGVQKELMQPTDIFVMDAETEDELQRRALSIAHAVSEHGPRTIVDGDEKGASLLNNLGDCD